jgi:pyridinium-3,5-biscarboxylic acid mononucleotide synthase
MLDESTIRQLLERFARRELTVDQAMTKMTSASSQDLGFATIDHQRADRCGFPEVIFCQGKTPEQVASIAAALAERSPQLLGTRATAEQFEAARKALPDLQYNAAARTIWRDTQPKRDRLSGVMIIAAGTSDLPVAEEAGVTLDLMGHAVKRVNDVGVAGLHRLLAHLPAMRESNVIVVVAGMEGALPSVVGGLVSAPVIAVPTSVGYGASFGGLAALLGMLNSCAAGIAVMNIDNGFGAGALAAKINARIHGVGAEDKESEF